MLKKHKEGGREAKVDPILYEKIIEYAIYYGKMGPEEKLYYLIQGIATGLLAPDRGSVINSAKINDYPSIDWFGSPTARGPKPTLADVQEVAQYDEPGFFDWYHRVAMTCDRVTQRVDKTLTQGNKLDHDDLTAFLAYMSETTTDTMLGKNTDGFRLPLTGVQNGTISMLHYMDNMAENADLMPNTPEAFTRFVGSFARYDAITMNRMYRRQGNDYFRWGLVDYNAKPRYVGFYKEVYGRDQLTAKQNMEKVRGYLSVLDPIFFDKIFNYSKAEMKDSEAQAIAQEAIDRYGTEDVFAGDIPKTVDELYQAASKLTAFVLRQHPEKFQEMRKKIKSEHKGQYSKYRKDRLVPAQERIDDMRKQRRAMQSVTPAFGSQIKEPPPPVTSGRKWTIGGQ
jgi:hypothetical protein